MNMRVILFASLSVWCSAADCPNGAHSCTGLEDETSLIQVNLNVSSGLSPVIPPAMVPVMPVNITPMGFPMPGGVLMPGGVPMPGGHPSSQHSSGHSHAKHSSGHTHGKKLEGPRDHGDPKPETKGQIKKIDAARPAAKPFKGAPRLDFFQKTNNVGLNNCYHRGPNPQTMIVDMHYHDRPFGGTPMPWDRQMRMMRERGILVVLLNGIGQRLPIGSPCTYYLDCQGTDVLPNMINDIWNGQEFLDWSERESRRGHSPEVDGPFVVISMTGFDLSKPETLLRDYGVIQRMFPGKIDGLVIKNVQKVHQWVGELNVNKQALWGNNGGKPITHEQIDGWAPFMAKLREDNMPMSLHCDIGNTEKPNEFLHIMDHILKSYPKNKIVWLHLGGLSKELHFSKKYKMEHHAELLQERFTKYPLLLVDMAWTILFDNIFFRPDVEDSNGQKKLPSQVFIDLIHKNPTRFLTGTDFVSAESKHVDTYNYEVLETSYVLKFLNNNAFRKVALGQNFFDIMDWSVIEAPEVCPSDSHFQEPGSTD